MPSAWIGIGGAVARSPNAHALYSVFVHRLALLLHASFRPRLTTTPLRFANPSPPSGWVEDFHLQAIEHARHTGWRSPRGVRPAVSWSGWRDRSPPKIRRSAPASRLLK